MDIIGKTFMDKIKNYNDILTSYGLRKRNCINSYMWLNNIIVYILQDNVSFIMGSRW